MKNPLYIIFFALFFCFTITSAQDFQKIPQEYLTHPELGKKFHNSNTSISDYELIHLRTEYSRTFLNTNTTKTTVASSAPLHILDDTGRWVSIDYSLTEKNNTLIFPSKNPTFVFDKSSQSTSLLSKSGQSLITGQNIQLYIIDEEKRRLKSAQKNSQKAAIKGENQLLINNYFDSVNVDYTFYDSALKTNYTLNSQNFFNTDFTELVLEETIKIPKNYQLQLEVIDNQNTNRILIVDENNNPVFVYQQPIITDSKEINPKFRHQWNPYMGRYSFDKINDNLYKIKIHMEASWLQSNDRVFPVIIDPIVTVENTNVVNSCFFPNYQQSTLNVNIPAGEDVLQTSIEYDFIAVSGSNGWMSDQRSFVTGPNGSTPVYSGTGDNEGLQTYQIINSHIGNGTSTGIVQYTFNFSRTWGGSGCNASFNFVNRRTLEVLHGTVIYGDGPIFINEYSASNMTHHLDGFGRTESWIELFNASPDTFFNLQGYHLSNDIDNPTLWQIENGIIPPNSRVLVYSSRRDISSGTVLHSNFNLRQLRPDQIVLANPQGEIMEAHEIYTTQADHSYGRTTDGGPNWGVFPNPTPGSPNNTNSYVAYTTKPTFSLEAGHYSSAVTVALASSGSNEVVRFTTDGSTPNETSTLYTAPFSVSQTTTVRARAFSSDPDYEPGFIETNTYLINENHSIPVFSFSGDADLLQLFNGNASLRPHAHFEYFESDGQFIDENFGDFNKHGNDSWSYPQRGVDFISRDEFGYNRRLEHPFFATSDRTRYRRLMVKAAANDNYPFENGGAHIRDSYIQTLSQLADLDLDERSSTNVIVYVNGEYWGVYDLRERVDDNNFTDYYYGQDYTFRESDIYLQFIKTWGSTQAHFGNAPALQDFDSLVQYIQNNNMGNATHFEYVDNLLNINSLIDYFVINSYVVSRDWLNYNTGWWRGLNPAGQARKWRYILWDMEAALGHFHNYTGLPNVTATAPPCQAEDLQPGNPHTTIIKKLIQENEQVREQYVTRYIDLLNTHLSSERVIQVLDSMVGVITPEMPRHIQRWGGNIATWENNVQNIRNFLLDRNAFIMSQGLANCYNLTGPFATNFNVVPENSGKIKMNSVWLENFPFTAQLFGNIDTHLVAEANTGYVFSHWEVDGAVVFPDINNPEIELLISQATNVTAHFQDPSQTNDTLIYYWHFNDLVTPEDVTTIEADFKLIEDAMPLMTYTGSGPRDIDAVNEGSVLNIHLNENAGIAARVRNPSENRALVFDLPTTGYKDIKFTYSVMRTNNGQLQNILSYTTNGTNFVQTGMHTTTFDIQTDFQLVHLDFSEIETVNDNPDFKIKIDFEGNTSNTNGNNRYDNITLKGVEVNLSNENFVLTEIQIFPNPFENNLTVISNKTINDIRIYDLLGKLVFDNNNINNNQTNLSLNHLSKGIYIIKIIAENSIKTHKIIKK